MPILYTPAFDPDAGFVFPRPYVCKFAVGWVAANVISAPPTLVLEETVFGGYRAHIDFLSWAWNWSTKRIDLDNLWLNFYVTAPGSSTPISAGITLVQYKWDDTLKSQLLVVSLQGGDGHYHFWDYPPAPPTYWLQTCGDYGA